MNNVTLRQVQLAQLEIAKEVKRICEKHDIRYFLDSGSLLGAVRHKGFIPWDDDVDIGFLREEYEKFLKIAPQELQEPFFLQTWDNDPEYPFAFAKVRKRGTVFVETAAMKSKAHNELYVDLFPYDAFPDDAQDRKKQGRKVMRYRKTLMMKSHMTPWRRNKNLIKFVGVFVKYLPYKLLSLISSRDRIKEKYIPVMQQFNHQNTRCVYEQSGGAKYGKWVLPRECFRSYVLLPFEDTEFSCPGDSDLYLKTVYGDYMTLPPKEKQVNHQSVQVQL